MYNHHFQLDGTPFSIAPDPRYLYMSAQHREALAHLLYGVDAGGGFVLLTGEVGAGKTTVCRCFLQQVGAQCRVAYIFNPRLSAAELLQTICAEFAIELPADLAPGRTRELVEALNRHLLESHARGEHNLLIIDEAQNLSADVLEQLRLLTNLETNERKLLQIVLIGQPELRQQVQQPALEQLAQRIIARYHLGPLSAPDCRAYIVHRLAVAGARSSPLFSEAAMRAVHRVSGGVPRKINLVCDRALLAAYARKESRVDEALVKQAATEIFSKASAPRRRPLASAVAALSLLLVLGAGWAWFGKAPAWRGESTLPVQSAVAAPAISPRLEQSLAPAAAKVASIADAQSLARAAWSEEDGLPQLSKLWGMQEQAGKGDCPELAGVGLFCYRLQMGLGQARELDRPFLLKLKAAGEKWVLVRDMDALQARLETANGPAAIRLPQLEAASDLEVLTLWRMDPGFRVQLLKGMRGPDVDWLARQLAAWADSAADAKPQDSVMDAALINRVRQFQQVQGLGADGVVGPRTWMKLNAVAGLSEPRLQASLNLASR